MIDIRTFIQVISFMTLAAGLLAGFIKMQTTQNMKIEQLQAELTDLKLRQRRSTDLQVDTDKALLEMGKDIKQILKDMDELKINGCRRIGEGHNGTV